MPKNMDSFPYQEEGESKPISELSTQEIEKILAQRKSNEAGDRREAFESAREARRRQFLKDLGEDVTMESHPGERQGERVSIYKDGKHLGDIISDNNLSGFTDREFQDKAFELVSGHGKKGVERKEEKPRVKINIESAARKLMNQMNMVLSGDRLTLQNDNLDLELYGDGENKEIDISKVDETKVLLRITEKSGKIIEYVIDGGKFLPDSRRVKIEE